jgi:3-hydroxyacyl-CoA dehydrogenase/enoyl-CoA hydratase/3-hydroxybutyryl-CoA epimerase
VTERNTIRWEQGEDGIVVLTLDDPEQSANTMNAAYAASMASTVDRLEAERDSITGVVIPRPRRPSSPAATSTT